MKNSNSTDLQEEVFIKFTKGQIPHLLGALRLGIWSEDWCAALVQTSCNSFDSQSNKWISQVSNIISQIKEQLATGNEDIGYGYDEVLSDLQTLVDDQCKKLKRDRVLS